MARKRKHPLPVQPPPPPALKDFDSDSPLGSPDSCCGSSSPSSASGGAGGGGGGGGGKADKPPMVRSAANARERSRMRVLSKAFSRLKTTLPWVPADTKLSKLDTLRLASCYIAHLREILADDSSNAPGGAAVTGKTGGAGKAASGGGKGPGGAGPNAPIHPLSLTWPFTFNGRVTMSPSSFASDVVASSRQKDALLSTSTSSSNQTSSCVSNKTPIAS